MRKQAALIVVVLAITFQSHSQPHRTGHPQAEPPETLAPQQTSAEHWEHRVEGIEKTIALWESTERSENRVRIGGWPTHRPATTPRVPHPFHSPIVERVGGHEPRQAVFRHKLLPSWRVAYI